MVEAPIDPLSLPKSKHKRIPGGDGDAPPPVLHSPNRKLTAKDQQDFKIPACASNWVNSKGHMRPL